MHFFLNNEKKQHIFMEICLYEVVGSLSVMSSLLPHVLWGRSQVSLSCLHFSLMFSEGEVKSPCCFVSVVSPDKIIPRFYSDIFNYFWDTVCTKLLTLGCFLACPSPIWWLDCICSKTLFKSAKLPKKIRHLKNKQISNFLCKHNVKKKDTSFCLTRSKSIDLEEAIWA